MMSETTGLEIAALIVIVGGMSLAAAAFCLVCWTRRTTSSRR